VARPCDLRVTLFVTDIEMVVMFAEQLVLSTSMIIWTIYPGVNPSLAKDILQIVIPLFMQQQLVISPLDSLCWLDTARVSLRMISLPPKILN
jgi:hypothetical protein